MARRTSMISARSAARQRLVNPSLDLRPDRAAAERFVVPGAGHQNQPLRSGQRLQYPRECSGRCPCRPSRAPAAPAADRRRGGDRADRVDLKAALLFRQRDGARDDAGGEKEWRTLGRDRSEIREGLGRDHCRHAWILSRFLQRHRRAERGADEHDRPGRESVEDAM